ncbi:MAG TPA: hypothetical protein VFA20_10065 [Myxococcaceae bacterium]|nr:hypothetical protein [Myxococcaceae bacterium]
MPTDIGISHANRNLGPKVVEGTKESGPQIEDASRTIRGARTQGTVGVEERAGVGDKNNGASVGAKAGVDYFAAAGATKDGHLKAVAVGSLGASVDATANGRLGNDSFNAAGKVQATAGANATGIASAQVGADGVKVGATGRAFAGAEVNGAASTHVGPLDAGVGGGLSVGIGAEGTASASFTKDKIGFQLKGGLTLGIGFNVNMNVSVNPSEVVKDVKNIGSSAVHKLEDAGSAVKHFFGF